MGEKAYVIKKSEVLATTVDMDQLPPPDLLKFYERFSTELKAEQKCAAKKLISEFKKTFSLKLSNIERTLLTPH